MKTVILIGLLLTAFPGSLVQAQTKPDKDYLVYVLSEAADKISLIRFGPAARASNSRLIPERCRSTLMGHMGSRSLPIGSFTTSRSHMVVRLDLFGSIRLKTTR